MCYFCHAIVLPLRILEGNIRACDRKKKLLKSEVFWTDPFQIGSPHSARSMELYYTEHGQCIASRDFAPYKLLQSVTLNSYLVYHSCGEIFGETLVYS